jgi:putative Ca2+/H+ antiporter (TMEM165/GDT1 family)
MNAWSDFFLSTGLVALAEIGDKTQLLAFFLSARFRRHWPIIWGILVATLANHALAGVVGMGLAQWMGPDLLRWILGLGFIAMGAWMLIPDKLDQPAEGMGMGERLGIFGTTVVAFFFAEMGDKTQVATVALAAQSASAYLVVLGTTLGMMIANVPAVLVGDRLADRLSPKWMHRIAAALFFCVGIFVLLGLSVDFLT